MNIKFYFIRPPLYCLQELPQYSAAAVMITMTLQILSMWIEIESGNITYDFKYQNGNFELIKVKKLTNNSTKGYTEENTIFTDTNFDLVKGIRTESDKIFGSEKPLSIRKEN